MFDPTAMLGGDLAEKLKNELEILKNAAATGSMDALVEVHEEEEWERETNTGAGGETGRSEDDEADMSRLAFAGPGASLEAHALSEAWATRSMAARTSIPWRRSRALCTQPALYRR